MDKTIGNIYTSFTHIYTTGDLSGFYQLKFHSVLYKAITVPPLQYILSNNVIVYIGHVNTPSMIECP